MPPDTNRSNFNRLVWLPLAGLLSFAALLACLSGCDSSTESATTAGPGANLPDPNWSQELFASSVDSIDHLEEFSGEMVIQAVQGLNQSLAGSDKQDGWQPDPMVFSLPLEYRELPAVKSLGDPTFDIPGALELQEAFWLRDASQAARGDRADDLSRATSLFDWTVRNFPLEPEKPAGGGYDLVHPPRQMLLLGRGDAQERAWLFMLLARQQGLDVVMLGIPDATRPQGYRPWAAALHSGGQLYLFDAALGLPILNANGAVATLEQTADDDSLLRALDLDGDPYPVKAADLKEVFALVEGSPGYLSRRMRMVELRLTGERKVALTVAASDLAERLRTCKHVRDAKLWDIPYRALAQQGTRDAQIASARELAPYQLDALPPNLRGIGAALQQGRVMHIRGKYVQEEDATAASANALYQVARVPDAELAKLKLTPKERAVLDHTKQDASFWLGLVAFERGRYPAAIEHLKKRTLEASPNGPWTAGANYNLARSYEALQRLPEAIALYEADQSPQRHGNLLRAKKLKGPEATEAPAATDAPADAAPVEAAPAASAPAESTPAAAPSPTPPAEPKAE